jgi:hypothetical protein
MMISIAAIVLAQAVAAPQPMAMDTPVTFGKLEVACTGVGSAKDDPQWSAYPVRIEFANAAAQYLSGAHVTIASGGTTIADVNCWGPWVLVKGAPGTYSVSATINGSNAKPASGNIHLATGAKQARVILRFPDLQPNQ